MELRDYLNVIRARKWVIIQAVVIVTLTALVVSLLQPPTYRGVAKILITDKDVGAAIFGTAVSDVAPGTGLQTQIQLMQARPLAERTVRKLGLREGPEQLLERITVSAAGQTNVVALVATDDGAKRAADIANSMAESYVEWSRETKRESIKLAADEVEKRLGDARVELIALGRKVNEQDQRAAEDPKSRTASQSNDLKAELQIAIGLYSTLAEKLETLRVNEQLEAGSGRVVSAAAVESTPISPRPARSVALGIAGGLLIGLGLAFLLEHLDNTIKSTEEVEKVYGAPVLGHIPAERFEKGERRRLTIVQHSGSPAAEAYRVLRNSLDFVNFEHDIKTLLVTSAAPGEGKSTVASNLAAGLAQAGRKVVLMSCDFRRPTTDQFFGVNNMIGLSEVLLGQHTLRSALQRPGDEQLLVLTSGKMPPNPSELLGSQKMADLIENLKEWADWIIIDSPPLLAVADAAALSRWVDGVLVVTRGGSSTRDAARKGREMLEKVGAKISGVVVWGLEEGGGAAGAGYYYSGYYYDGYYSGYYTERGQASATEALGQSGKHKRRKGLDSGAQAPVEVVPADMASEQDIVIAVPTTGQRIAASIGRILAAVVSFAVAVALVTVIAYLLDQYFGWGVGSLLRGIRP